MFNRVFKSEHQHVEEMLSAYLDGELSPKEKARVEKHLARCADCAQNLRTLRQTVALLRQLPPVAVPRSFAIRPGPAAPRPSLFQTRRAYVYLRAATALATILLAVVLAGDAFLTGLAPHLAPARAPEVISKEVVVEKEVPITIEKKEVVVEKKVVETVIVEKEVPVEVEKEVVVEKEAAYEATPLPAPAEKEEVHAPKPLPTPAVVGKGIETAPAAPSIPKAETPAKTPLRLDEERIEATAVPTPLPAEPVFTPTAVAEVLPQTPLPQEPTVRAIVSPRRPGLVLLRTVEVGLLALVLVLALATLVARRRQGAR